MFGTNWWQLDDAANISIHIAGRCLCCLSRHTNNAPPLLIASKKLSRSVRGRRHHPVAERGLIELSVEVTGDARTTQHAVLYVDHPAR